MNIPANESAADRAARHELLRAARAAGLDVTGGILRRTSSRFCFGVEHGDYNGTELFGVGTDRFLWLAAKPNGTDQVRVASANFPADGVMTFRPGATPPPRAPALADHFGRFVAGADFVLRRAGHATARGFDAALFGNIPGGGMSRSASLTINLLLTMLDLNGLRPRNDWDVIEMAQAVETDYIGSPCGQLDQIMIYFARAGMGTHYTPRTRAIRHIPLGPAAPDFRILSLDTGTVRPGLEKSTYKIRRAECEELLALTREEFGLSCLADVRDPAVYERMLSRHGAAHPHLCARLKYLFAAQQRFADLLAAWTAGDLPAVGRIFRADGLGLRDDYQISGPELETMCDIVRTVPGVLGERMLGGGDKGAAGALALAEAAPAVRAAVAEAYPRSRPHLADRYAVHECRMVDGVVSLAPPEETGVGA